MSFNRFHLALAILLAGCFAALPSCQAAFQDPLLTAALQTDRLTLAPMTAVAHAGPRRLVAAGWRGLIAWSDDSGNSWHQAAVPVREDLTAISFPTDAHGWAVGNEGVLLETTDAGRTWTKRMDGRLAAQLMVDKYQALAAAHPGDKTLDAALREARNYQDQAPARPFLDVAFRDERTGYIVGTFNMVFRTVDGGKTWEPLFEKTANPDAYNIYAVRLVGEDVYLVGELGLALRLDPVRDYFERMPVPYDGTLFTVASTGDALLVAGLRGHAFRSTDRGRSWVAVDFGGLAPGTFTGMATSADGDVVLVTVSGQILASHDSGRAFHAVNAGEGMYYAGVAALQGGRAVVVGLRGIRTESIR